MRKLFLSVGILLLAAPLLAQSPGSLSDWLWQLPEPHAPFPPLPPVEERLPRLHPPGESARWNRVCKAMEAKKLKWTLR